MDLWLVYLLSEMALLLSILGYPNSEAISTRLLLFQSRTGIEMRWLHVMVEHIHVFFMVLIP